LGTFCRYALERHSDVSGVSGTGLVAVGVQFPSGKCVTEWAPNRHGHRGIVQHDTVAGLLDIHGHGGQTTLRWLDGAPDA
jgi:hypothetical protein